MALTYSLIASQTLSTAAITVSFNSIPSTFTDLIIRSSTRVDAPSNYLAYMQVTYSNDSSSTYSGTLIYSSGTSGSGVVNHDVSTTTLNLNGLSTGGLTLANSFAVSEIYIPNYGTTTSHPAGAYFAAENNSTTSDQTRLGMLAGQYQSGIAITSVTLGSPPSTGGYVSGSTFYLYGIRKS